MFRSSVQIARSRSEVSIASRVSLDRGRVNSHASKGLCMASEAVHEFTDDNFDSEVLKAEGAVLVDFWAPWCGPCRQIAPVIEELAKENPGVKIGKVNIDDNPGSAERFGVSSIPTLMVFRDGQVAESFVGVRPKTQLQAAIS